jgi:hypothetical protein
MTAVGKAELKSAWTKERDSARTASSQGEWSVEWTHLERARIVSQPKAGMHVRTHVAMLGYALRHRQVREIAGQLLRVTVAAPGSWTGRYPLGNTGGDDVSALLPMSVPADLRYLLDVSVAQK